MQRSVIAIALATGLAAPWLACAQQSAAPTNYVKLSVGQSDTEIDFWGGDTDTVVGFAVGSQVSSNIDVELGYSHFGTAKYADVGAVGNTLKARTEALYLAAVGKYAMQPAVSIYGKLGLAYHWSDRRGVRNGAAFDANDDRLGPLVGIGASWQFTPSWAADAEYTYFNRTSKLAGEVADIGVWTVGLRYVW